MRDRRKPVTKAVERDVLLASGRRCCLCVFLNNRDEVRKGQVAHLSRDAADSRFENLVWLCLEHHDEYDGRTSQSKGFQPEEVRTYRNKLYAQRKAVATQIAPEPETYKTIELEPLPATSEYHALRRDLSPELDFTTTPWRFPLWQVANEPELFAYKASNRADGVCLIERIDLPDERIVIACIEVAGNPGMSITNCVEDLCFQVCERFDIPPARLVWLENYDYFGSEWDMVRFGQMPPSGTFADPTWTRMTPELWRGLRLKPKRRLAQSHGHYHSKLAKLFDWQTQALL